MTLQETSIGGAARSNLASGWTDERVAWLKRLVARGRTASQIGAEMGIGRGAVVSKVARMGMRLGTPPTKPRAQPVPAPVKTAQPAKLKIRPGHKNHNTREVMLIPEREITDLPPDESPFACTIVELGADMCRYPIGDAHDLTTFRYCGAPCVGSWCARHRGIVFTKAERT